ncbi:MAG: DNA phosphorothioation system sulfurtransferase DndC [Proteobacteria bacterium]|nr:DNA phosphorothioation system sulfurtransferase DndC [Pseudomonadota bacterium]NBP15845.1 DNA phosphorothioation system sulfurtransferase DndC [bacterium]
MNQQSLPLSESASKYEEIKNQLKELYQQDPRPWLVGFSGGKDSTLVASLIFSVAFEMPPEIRNKPIAILCTDTRVEIPAILETVEGTLSNMQKFSNKYNLNIEVHLLRPPADQSFWVNIIGRGYPPPNRSFRWCTQRLKIDPVTVFVQKRVSIWGEAILHLGARRAESATRARLLKGRSLSNGLRRHENLAKVWIANPIEHLTTEEVWAYLLQRKNIWGDDNKSLYRLYANASGGECPLVVDKNSPSCGNSRFGCWTCTVVEKDKASQGLLASGDKRMEHLIEFRDVLAWYRDPSNGKRDNRRMNGADGHGPLVLQSRKELLVKILELEKLSGIKIVSDEELFLIQRHWKAARSSDSGDGVALIVSKSRGIKMKETKELNDLVELENTICKEKDINPETLRRLLSKAAEYSESAKAIGLPDDLLRILQDDLQKNK